MNSLDRIRAAIHFQSVDRVPVIGQVFGHAAVLAGVDLGEYVRDGALLARCQLHALETYHQDAVFALMDVGVETEALGSTLRYEPHQYPTVRKHALADGANLGTLTVPDPSSDGRMPELLRAAEILHHAVGDEVLVVGCVVGPMTLATQLLGVERALFLAIDDPDAFARLLDFAAAVAIRFGLAQLSSGVHLPLIFDPSASPALIPAPFFREFELPRLQRVFDAFREAGALANWLHITGPAASIFPYYSEAGVDIANFDYLVDPETAIAALPGVCLDGNIKPLAFVDGTPHEIAAEADRLRRHFADRGGYILAPGCEVPPESNPENIAALILDLSI